MITKAHFIEVMRAKAAHKREIEGDYRMGTWNDQDESLLFASNKRHIAGAKRASEQSRAASENLKKRRERGDHYGHGWM